MGEIIRRTTDQLVKDFQGAEYSIESARRNLAIKIEEKIGMRARFLGEDRFPSTTVLMGDNFDEARIIVLGLFQGTFNRLAYVDPAGKIFVARTRIKDMKDALDLNTSIPIRDVEEYDDHDMLDLDGPATNALNQHLQSLAE